MNILSAVVLLTCVAYVVSQESTYTSKYDNIDIDRILGNDRILTSYIKCMLDQGSCTPEGRELKKTLPDALKRGCDKCNPKQKDVAEKVVRHLTQKRPKDWEKLVQKYDPQGAYRKKFEEFRLQAEKNGKLSV
ncbi:ejaculatory bulb-specific protein 3-like [Harmonia axyridis]|uniref:ejaculatory bulb-specific protein 3-like n=1 Tax=Harmonia axyridis TaxID=115357 RepID=UPI001E279737|nr:ejaculatory bulb-specific protein 3-like [Harmonia axyridis]